MLRTSPNFPFASLQSGRCTFSFEKLRRTAIAYITFDTNVLLSATLWDESVAQKLLFDLIKQNVKIYSSTKILSEYQEILKRDFDFSDEDITEILEKVLAFVTLVNPTLKVEVVKEDPDDDPIIECALESNSKYIITYDRHLLNIKEYEEIQIIRPEEARAIFWVKFY